MTQASIPESYHNPELRTKKLILAISDIPLATTGVAVQFNQLITATIATGEYSFYVLGGAVQHPDMDIKIINPDFILEPCQGQGNKELLRKRLTELQPDAVFIFTDPHQYIYLWEMADEIHQIAPILYWHVWDNDPYPDCNTVWYESTDFIGTISKLTHDLVTSKFSGDKVKYIPHTFSRFLYYPFGKDAKKRAAEFFLQDKAEEYKLLWVNRNGHRKQLLELLETFKMFLDYLQETEGHKKAQLVLRTEPRDPEGPDIMSTIERLGILDNVKIIEEKLDYGLMNVLYNSADLVLNISKAEGFGLTLLTAMNTKTLMTGVMTGGMKEQIVHPETGEEFGLPIRVNQRNLVGSQIVPYIFEDYCSREDVLEAIKKAYHLSEAEYTDYVERAYKHATEFFGYDNIMAQWKTAFDTEIVKFKENKLGKNQWSITPVSVSEFKEAAIAKAQKQQIEAHRMQMMQQQQQNVKSQMMSNVLEKLRAQQGASK